MTPEDAELLLLFRERDPSAIERFNAKYGEYLHTVAFNILGNEPDCEECLNDVCLALWNNAAETEIASLRAYAAGITRRKAFSVFRGDYANRRRGSQLAEAIEEHGELTAEGYDAESQFETAELARIINGFVESLAERDRFIFISRYYESRTSDQIASELGTSGSAVRKRLAKLKTKLKQTLERNGYTC
ncbi:MAG: sigma-70 family RNA polymerase sigma factor [Clostridia bacterium]|nr:sigma-70 family RNA polymerase sigma factor [Clostridia bacterium]